MISTLAFLPSIFIGFWKRIISFDPEEYEVDLLVIVYLMLVLDFYLEYLVKSKLSYVKSKGATLSSSSESTLLTILGTAWDMNFLLC